MVKEEKRTRKEKLVGMLIMFLLMTGIAGCTLVPEEQERKEAAFVIVTEAYIPERLLELIELKKEQVMKLTYVDEGSRYIVIGYGKQESGGYSIAVRDFYMTQNALYVDTCLMGPDKKPDKEGGVSYPYLVLKTTQLGLPVVFQ
ncbi:MAG: protease complex subunit PrcB family protein [Lachnospiraceae bacterium]|nr:protease complex subunit PrcB family protein [Lachnospiraceae bacterium]